MRNNETSYNVWLIDIFYYFTESVMERGCRLLLPVVAILVMVTVAWACNEAVCASLVSKCMLLKSCECNMMDKNNCTCCKDCHKCLAKLYSECCDCVGKCQHNLVSCIWHEIPAQSRIFSI